MSKTLNDEELLDLLRKLVKQSSQKQVSADLGVSRAFLNDILHGRRSMTERIAAAMGYQRLVIYRKVA